MAELSLLLAENDLLKLAAICARHSKKGDIWALSGDLGAGKSTFARAFLNNLGVREDIPSPTFTLVQTYETDKAEIWHTDLYRLTSKADLQELGLLDDLSSRILLIEWPEKAGDIFHSRSFHLKLDFLDDLDKRKGTITAPSALVDRLQQIESSFYDPRK